MVGLMLAQQLNFASMGKNKFELLFSNYVVNTQRHTGEKNIVGMLEITRRPNFLHPDIYAVMDMN